MCSQIRSASRADAFHPAPHINREDLDAGTGEAGAALAASLTKVAAHPGRDRQGRRMARYTIRASNSTGSVEFLEVLTIDAALAKAEELRDAHFKHIGLINIHTGVEITDLERLIQTRGGQHVGSSR
jgi:hypothetical protein